MGNRYQIMLFKSVDKLKIITFGIKAVFIGCFFLLISCFLLLHFYSYDQFTLVVLQVYSKTDKLEIFRSMYLTEQRFITIRILLSVFVLLCIAVVFWWNKATQFVSARIISLIQSIQDFWKYLLEYYLSISKQKRLLFWGCMFLMALIRLFFLNRYYFQNDELFSYLFFVRKGFFVLASYYPGPNNHIFYSLLANLTLFVWPDPYYAMKLPSFLVGCAAPVFLFLFLKRYYSFSVSLIGAVLFSFSIHFFYYSLFGRGYALITFLTIFSFFMSLEIMNGSQKKFVWHIYVLASVLAFYTLPSYLYAFVSLAFAIGLAVIIEKRYEMVRPFLYYHSMVVALVLLLYSPVVLVSGLDSLTSNPWVARLDSAQFFALFPGMIRNMFGYVTNMETGATVFCLIVFGFSSWAATKTGKRSWMIAVISLFAGPIIILVFQRVNPFDRVWTYLILPFSISLVILVDFLFLQIKHFLTRQVLSVLIVSGIAGYTVCYFYKDTSHGHMIYDEVSRISRETSSKSNGKVYTNEDVYNLYIRYESSRLGREIIPEMSSASDLAGYSHVLLIPGSDFPGSIHPQDYWLKEQNPYIEVYELK